MKNTAIVLFAAIASFSFTACNSNADSETTDADSLMIDNTAVDGANEMVYYDLSTGNQLRKDQSSGRFVDEAGTPSEFYVDVQAADTFEGATGRNVNNAMTRIDNTWRLDEARVKVTENKTVIQDENSKLKVKEDKAKLITEDQKVKAKTNADGETEVKVKAR